MYTMGITHILSKDGSVIPGGGGQVYCSVLLSQPTSQKSGYNAHTGELAVLRLPRPVVTNHDASPQMY